MIVESCWNPKLWSWGNGLLDYATPTINMNTDKSVCLFISADFNLLWVIYPVTREPAWKIRLEEEMPTFRWIYFELLSSSVQTCGTEGGNRFFKDKKPCKICDVESSMPASH